MIAAGNPQDFVPYGREHCKLHPGKTHFQTPSSAAGRVDLGVQLLTALKDVSLKDKLDTPREQWLLRSNPETADTNCEEELYACGHTVIWSKGSSLQNRYVCKTFTVDYPVQQVLWCDFFLANNKPCLLRDGSENQTDIGKIQPSICIVDTVNLNAYTINGEQFITSLPFQVGQVWPIKFGLLLERIVTPVEKNSPKKELPTLFSLLHPLDEITPVIKVNGTSSSLSQNAFKVSCLNDQHMQIVFTSTNPSLVMFYNSILGVHSIWNLRKSSIEEIQGSFKVSENFSNSQNFLGSPHNTFQSSSSHSRFTLSSHSPSQFSTSPFRNYSSRVNSPLQQSRSLSPNLSGITHMAALSRSQSPSAVIGNSTYRYQSSLSPARSPSSFLKQANSNTHSSFLGDNHSDLVEPLAPDVCLELLWNESNVTAKCTEDGKASRAFITSDFVGQKFLCYVVPAFNQLRCIKFEESNDQSQLIFGVVTVIPARDAHALNGCEMILIVDINFTLVLYTGINKMCTVHVPSTPVSFLGISEGHLIPGFHRRGSLVTSSRPPSAMDARFDEEVHLLSPVTSENNCSISLLENSFIDEPSLATSLNIVKLSDPVHNKITLEYHCGYVCRITIPKINESFLVQKCLQAARNVLPKEVALQLYTKWYSTVNALGSRKNSRSHEWSVFVACLLGLMGYDIEKLSMSKQFDFDLTLSPPGITKKFKSGDMGSEEDWQFLLSSNYSSQNALKTKKVFGLNIFSTRTDISTTGGNINSNAVLFPHIPAILYALHLVYEELKLNALLWSELDLMIPLLMQLARDLRVNAFLDYYWRDKPDLLLKENSSQINEDMLKYMQYPSFLTAEPPSIFYWLYECLKNGTLQPFPYLPSVTENIKKIALLFAVMCCKCNWNSSLPEKCLKRISHLGFRSSTNETSFDANNSSSANANNIHELVVSSIAQLGFELKDLERLPVGVSLPLRNAIFHCRRNPPSNWSEALYCLIGRQDLSAQLKDTHKDQVNSVRNKLSSNDGKKPTLSKDDDDGMEHLDYEVLKLRFDKDQRIQEVRRLLQSSKPVRIALVQRPEVSDHDFIEEQERYLYAVCMRTMALPIGRGMFTLRTSQPVVTETLPIPKLCLTGRAPPRNTTVDLSHVEPPSNMNVWPLFHNGVAAGIRIMPNASQIDSTWIIYNKPKGSNEMPMEHAGFLMALGLNGHLNNLATMNIHDYLCKGHEMTSVGLLLGISAAKRGTMDVAITKLLSIHIEALLPPTSTELDVPHVAQVAAILGVGLVYEGTAHRHISEVLLSEIGRPPGPEMENSTDRESYSLAAGLALGLVTFGLGNDLSGLLELGMADQLYHFMVGGHKRPMTGVHKEKYKSPSYQIKEGDAVNIDVTSPGATLALGMLYFRTRNRAVADWMTVPDTQFLLDFVRADFLLLRTFSKGLIMWDDILPSSKWIQSHIPELIAKHAFKKNRDNDNVDYETMNQAYCNILAGACLALGFRFAGSANEEAFKILMEYVKLFINDFGKQMAEQTGRNTIDTCLNVVLLSLAMVMAGTGDLEVLRICRYLHFRIGQPNNYVLYGSHMATHMAIGLLFLGGGKYTLSTKPSAVAAMICAFFPKFPIHSSDNRYHLQAFRHLYVLAIEPRLIIPRDIDNSKACYTNLKIKFKDSQMYSNVNYHVRAPCLLPELDHLEEIVVEDSRYWPVHFHREKNWNSLKCLLENQGTLYVKQKAGCLSYIDDPQGYRSFPSLSILKNHIGNWSVKPEVIEMFSCDSSVLNFAKYFLQQESENQRVNVFIENELKQLFCGIFYECVTEEKMEILPTCITIIQILSNLQTVGNLNGLWQIKLVLAFNNNILMEHQFNSQYFKYLLNPEFATAMQSLLEKQLRKWHKDSDHIVKSYLSRQSLPEGNNLIMLSAFLMYCDIAPSYKWNQNNFQYWSNLAAMSLQLKDYPLSTWALMTLINDEL